MELIKITESAPIAEYMESTLNEAECDKLFKDIQTILESDDMKKALKEDAADLVAGGIIAGSAVLLIISSLIKWIRNKYRLTVQKIYDQSKELNDLYVKVSDLLQNDKMARFRHRNDKIDAETKSVVMKDLKDPRKVYVLGIDYLAYDPEYFINEIDDIMKYVDKESKNKKADMKSMKEALMKKIDDNFNANHGFVTQCEPIIKCIKYKNQRLEDVLTVYKDSISFIYAVLYKYNRYTASELQYMQLMQQAYNRMLATYGKDKEQKACVDEVFKKLLKNVTLSMDFNAKSMTLFEGIIKYYAEELQKLYDFIRK